MNLVSDRKAEIGLMKAVGTTKKTILKIFIGESMAIGFSGSLVGSILQFLIQFFLNNVIKGETFTEGQMIMFGLDIKGISFITPLWLTTLVIALVTIFALLGGFIPANKAANMDPIDALRDL
jgi:putative ABC transport system permease protein